VIVENNKVDAGAPNAGGNARGYDVRGSVGTNAVIVRNNSYTTGTSSNDQHDGMWSSENNGVRWENNNIVISNSFSGTGNGHNDFLQSLNDISITVVGNYCEQANTKTGNAQGYWLENVNTGGTHTVYNNVAIAPNTFDSLFFTRNATGFTGKVLFYNNSGRGSRTATLQIDNSPNSEAKNNILYSPHTNGRALKVVGTLPSTSLINFNLYYVPNSTEVVSAPSGQLTWIQWRNLGYEANGLNTKSAVRERYRPIAASGLSSDRCGDGAGRSPDRSYWRNTPSGRRLRHGRVRGPRGTSGRRYRDRTRRLLEAGRADRCASGLFR
jgi:hypothetical protein